MLQVVERHGQEGRHLLVMDAHGNGDALGTRVRLQPLPHSEKPLPCSPNKSLSFRGL